MDEIETIQANEPLPKFIPHPPKEPIKIDLENPAPNSNLDNTLTSTATTVGPAKRKRGENRSMEQKQEIIQDQPTQGTQASNQNQPNQTIRVQIPSVPSSNLHFASAGEISVNSKGGVYELLNKLVRIEVPSNLFGNGKKAAKFSAGRIN